MTTRRIRVAAVLLKLKHPLIATRLLLPGLFIGLMGSVAFIISYDHSHYQARAAGVDIYMAQSAAGTGDGSSCANTRAVSFFNTAANWGVGTGQIGPSTTVHLCGTITSPLAAQGSGASGSPIIILFEPNAKLSEPACPGRGTGCLNLNNRNYITVDGGTNGIIENTDSGTHLTHHGGSYGINATSCASCEVKNLTIQNIYVHDGSGDFTEVDQTTVRAIDFSGSNFLFHDNIIHDAGWAVTFGGDNMSNDRLYNNNIYNVDHGITPSFSGTGTTGPMYLYDNHFHDFANWDTTSNTFHHDGIHCFSAPGSPGETINGFYIYNNKFDGDIGGHATSWIFLEGGSGASGTPCNNNASTIYIFNNYLTSTPPHWSANDAINVSFGNELVANNTVAGPDATNNGAGGCFSWTSGSTVYNNAAGGCNQVINGSSTATVDYNAYADCTGSFNCFAIGPSSNWTADFSLYQSRYPTFDVHSVADLSTTVGANAAGAGKNLTSLCTGDLISLCSDIDGNPRPSTGAWDAGATQVVPLANVWISTTGDDSTCIRGEQTKPCATADKAASLAQAGDIIQVEAGNYEHLTIVGRCFSDWVTFEPVPGKTVVVDGANGGMGDFGGSWELTGSGAGNCYIRIQGFEMTDRVFVDLNASHIDIIDNNIHSKIAPNVDSTAADITASGVVDRCSGAGCTTGIHNLSIRDNTIKNVGYVCRGIGTDPNACDTADNNAGVGYGYCIQDGYGVDTSITGNVIDGCWEDAMQLGATGVLVVTDNDVTNVTGGASGHQDGIQIFTTQARTGAEIERNNFHGPMGSSCMRIQDGDRYNFTIRNNVCAGALNVGLDLEHLHNSIISFNTIGASANGSNLSGDVNDIGTSDPDDNLIENNIFEDASNSCSWGLSGSNETYRYNIVTDPCGSGGGAIVNCTPGCLTSHPVFVNATSGADMHLIVSSVGIDSGNAEPGVNSDNSGQPRPIDVASVADTGGGDPAYFDIGADEYLASYSPPPTGGGTNPTPPPPTYKQGDCNHDNAVNIFDLSILLSHYNSNYSSADFDTNAIVNVIDLSILLSNYGK